MAMEPQARPPPPPPEAPSNEPPHGQPAPLLPKHVVVEHILTRVPAVAVLRFRTVCRSWRDALSSEHFVEAHRVARATAAAHPPPELVFFTPAPAAPSACSDATAFYTCKLNLHDKAAQAHELVTVGNLRSWDLSLAMSSTRPCRGLTLLYSLSATSAYHVFNLSTGEHVSLPLCTPPHRHRHSYSSLTISSAGLGFDPAASEHKVVRLYNGSDKQPRCEVYGLRSGGWRPCAGQVPHDTATKWCMDVRRRQPSPVFVDGCFYWHIDPRAILSLTASTEEFSWVDAPGRRPVRSVHRLAELDGSLCAMVELDRRLSMRDELELWTRAAAGSGGPPPSWSMRCRISFYKLPWKIRHRLGRGRIPIASLSDGKILLATSCYELYAYDPERVSAERVFSMEEFDVKYTSSRGAEEVLYFALHEDSVTGVRRRPVSSDDDGGQLKVKHGSSTLARREAYLGIINPRNFRGMINSAMKANNLM